MKLNRLLSLLLAGVMALGLAAPGFADALPPGETAAAVDATLPAEDAPLVNEEPPAPVSYTHLDVYKRQVRRCTGRRPGCGAASPSFYRRNTRK